MSQKCAASWKSVRIRGRGDGLRNTFFKRSNSCFGRTSNEELALLGFSFMDINYAEPSKRFRVFYMIQEDTLKTLEAFLELAEKATKRPWFCDSQNPSTTIVNISNGLYGDDWRCIAKDVSELDGQLIAQARTLAPRMAKALKILLPELQSAMSAAKDFTTLQKATGETLTECNVKIEQIKNLHDQVYAILNGEDK